ncbi:MAG: HNH endonuclease [Candidatus Kapaibacterium sp.]|jgi:hypothetical protein
MNKVIRRWKDQIAILPGEIFKKHSNGNEYSNKGRFKTPYGRISFGNKDKKQGYMRQAVKIADKKFQTRPLHRIIMECWDPLGELIVNYTTDMKAVVDHIDGNKINNNIENLEWVSYQENSKRYIANK